MLPRGIERKHYHEMLMSFENNIIRFSFKTATKKTMTYTKELLRARSVYQNLQAFLLLFTIVKKPVR